jgi:hypothetical protein
MADSHIPYVGPIVTRASAIKRGENRYFDGRRCHRGHLSQRYTRNFACVACAADDDFKRNPRHPRALLSSSIDAMFWHTIPIPECGCWVWTGAMLECGYGFIAVAGKRKLAHRLAYELAIGPIPDGLEIDHLCRVRSCINPSHLEPVSHQVNVKRGNAGKITGARNRAITHCPRGHAYSGDNLHITTRGSRWCRACHRDRMRALKCS